MNSGTEEVELAGFEKGVSGNLLMVSHAHFQQGNKNLFLYIKNKYIHVVYKHIYGISMVLGCQWRRAIRKKSLKKIPYEGDNEKEVEKHYYAKHIFPFNYVVYLLPIQKN